MKIKKTLVFILGVQVLALGIALMVIANLGVSVGTAVSYVLSRKFTFFTMGVWNYLCHALVMLMLIYITRQIRLIYFLSFLTSVFLGYSLDFYNWLLKDFLVSFFVFRLMLLLLGIVCVGLGIAMTLVSDFPPAPFDLFTKELSRRNTWPMSKVKTIFDVSCLTLGLILSLSFFKQIIGIGIGTVLSALGTGIVVGFSQTKLSAFFNETKPVAP